MVQPHNRHMSFSLYISVLAVTDTIALLKGKIDFYVFFSFPFCWNFIGLKGYLNYKKIDLMWIAFSLKVKLLQYMKKYIVNSDISLESASTIKSYYAQIASDNCSFCLFYHYLPPTKLWQGNIFSRICLSVNRVVPMRPLPILPLVSHRSNDDPHPASAPLSLSYGPPSRHV